MEGLERFIKAQEFNYEDALAEINAIKDRAEALAYVHHPMPARP